jgi:catechol 2,3-dioxygenase-like lactoylglutathione lyase family enzyme
MRPGPGSHLRLARPSRNLAAAERFWVDRLGLQVLWRSEPGEQAHDLLMLGWPDAGWHLELVGDPHTQTPPAPTEEDLLVLYLDGPLDDDLEQQLTAAGGRRVPSRNPYWDTWGLTIVDPDGYRLVLSTRGWG